MLIQNAVRGWITTHMDYLNDHASDLQEEDDG